MITKCPVCLVTYDNGASLRSHISRKHPDHVKHRKSNTNTTNTNPAKNTKYTSNISFIKNSSTNEQTKIQLVSLEMGCLNEAFTNQTVIALVDEIHESDIEASVKTCLIEKLQKYIQKTFNNSKSVRNVNVNHVDNIIINADEKQSQSPIVNSNELNLASGWIIYVLITREYKNLNASIYKVGVTSKSIKKRFWQYPKDSELLYTERCDSNLEDKVLANMCRNFKLVEGREWFEGPINDIIFVVKTTTSLHKPKFDYTIK